jgi:hypothetical protein
MKLSSSFDTMNTVQISFYNRDHLAVRETEASFLNFSTKEEYLEQVAAWRDQYNEVSDAIRAVKSHNRNVRRSRDVIRHRMNGVYSGQEYANRWLTMARHNQTVDVTDWDLSVKRIHPTELLEIRAQMKIQAGRQMEDNFTEIEDIGLVIQRMAAVAAAL